MYLARVDECILAWDRVRFGADLAMGREKNFGVGSCTFLL